jgi:adhesin HecA-like repeat protein
LNGLTISDKDININLSDELFNSSSVISAKQDLSITANKITNETDSVATHQLYRKWGKKWVEGFGVNGDVVIRLNHA